mmetsp:Transcript_718/g.1578  ORF Transcript_718/g.1578 Transcript_718/m.1578 type:complete len:169 (+) Transcript_718:143-649(+)
MSHKNVQADITPPVRWPMAAKHARPPSSRKIGNSWNADDIIPNLPTTTRGCIGTGWANGSIIVLGSNHDRIDPRRKCDFISSTDKTGKPAISIAEALPVSITPRKTIQSDAARAAIGPLNEKSTRADRLLGNDRKGVMHPKNGNAVTVKIPGTGTGKPIFIFFRFATI